MIEIPWRKEFVHEVTIGAALGERYDENASQTVMFPANRDLNVKVQVGRPTYRPGEDVVALLDARAPSGKPVEAALGVAVVDAAVGERARTDAEAHGTLSYAWSWHRGGTDELAGRTRQDLYRLDFSEPFSEDLDLLAEVMLAYDPYWPNVEASVDYTEQLHQEFSHALNAPLKPALEVLNARYAKDYHHQQDLQDLRRDLLDAGIELDALRDPWGGLYRVEFETVKRSDVMRFVSAGPDKRFGTSDDLVGAELERAHFKPAHDAIERALKKLPEFPQTKSAARTALLAANLDPDQQRDPWGTSYHSEFRITRDLGVLSFRSAGPDRIFGTADDFVVDEVSGHYFAGMQERLAKLLADTKSFPQDERAWNGLLRSACRTMGRRAFPSSRTICSKTIGGGACTPFFNTALRIRTFSGSTQWRNSARRPKHVLKSYLRPRVSPLSTFVAPVQTESRARKTTSISPRFQEP